jgi:hypothetical protein
VRGCRTRARDLLERVVVLSIMRKEGQGMDVEASSRARVRPVGPAPMMRISVSVILVGSRELSSFSGEIHDGNLFLGGRVMLLLSFAGG